MNDDQTNPSQSASAASKHQRGKPRYAADLKVELFTKGLNHHSIERTANISSGGLFLCTDLGTEIGERVHLRIVFSDKDAYFDVKGTVVWICDGQKGHPKGFGVEFTDLNRAQQEIVNKHLSQYINVRDR